MSNGLDPDPNLYCLHRRKSPLARKELKWPAGEKDPFLKTLPCRKFGKNIISPRGYKTFSMLNLVEHEIYPAHKC